MMDEKQQPDTENGWEMPEPIFRSTKGYNPLKNVDAEADILTETADESSSESETGESETGELINADEKQHVRPKAPAKKKGGCLSTAAFFVGIICLSLAAVLAALLYFLYFYVPEPTGGF